MEGCGILDELNDRLLETHGQNGWFLVGSSPTAAAIFFFRTGVRMIEQVIGLVRDGNEQPQFFMLTIRYPNQGAGYMGTSIFGTESHLRTVLAQGGIPEATINILFANVP